MSKTINDKLDILQADYKSALDAQTIINAELMKKLDEAIKKLSDNSAKKAKAEVETKTNEPAPAKGFAVNVMNWFQREFAKDKNITNKYLSEDLKKDYQKRISEDADMKDLAGPKRNVAECKMFWNTYCKAGASTRSAVVLDAIKKDYETAKKEYEATASDASPSNKK